MKTISRIAILFLVLAVVLLNKSCTNNSQEIDRVSFSQLSTIDSLIEEKIIYESEGNEILEIWSNTKLSYEGEFPIRFRMRVILDSVSLANLELNPTNFENSKIDSKTQLGDYISQHLYVQPGGLNLEESGTYEFHMLMYSLENKNVDIEKAELIFVRAENN